MPNAATALALVETATKCRATAASSPPMRFTSHSRAEFALVIVSWVVKVLEATMNSVRSGSSLAQGQRHVRPSTLETKKARRPFSA